MVKTIDIDVDFNGMIIFDYPGILAPFGGKIILVGLTLIFLKVYIK